MSYRFGMTCGRVNDNRIFIFESSIPLKWQFHISGDIVIIIVIYQYISTTFRLFNVLQIHTIQSCQPNHFKAGAFAFWYHVLDTPHFSCTQACILRISVPVLRPPWSPPPPPGSVAPIVRLSGTALLAARDLNEGHPTPLPFFTHGPTPSPCLKVFFFIKVAPRSYDGAPYLHYHAPDPLSFSHTHARTHTHTHWRMK